MTAPKPTVTPLSINDNVPTGPAPSYPAVPPPVHNASPIDSGSYDAPPSNHPTGQAGVDLYGPPPPYVPSPSGPDAQSAPDSFYTNSILPQAHHPSQRPLLSPTGIPNENSTTRPPRGSVLFSGRRRKLGKKDPQRMFVYIIAVFILVAIVSGIAYRVKTSRDNNDNDNQ